MPGVSEPALTGSSFLNRPRRSTEPPSAHHQGTLSLHRASFVMKHQSRPRCRLTKSHGQLVRVLLGALGPCRCALIIRLRTHDSSLKPALSIYTYIRIVRSVGDCNTTPRVTASTSLLSFKVCSSSPAVPFVSDHRPRCVSKPELYPSWPRVPLPPGHSSTSQTLALKIYYSSRPTAPCPTSRPSSACPTLNTSPESTCPPETSPTTAMAPPESTRIATTSRFTAVTVFAHVCW